MVAGRCRRKPLQVISIGVREQIVRFRGADISCDVVLLQVPVPFTKNTGRRIMQSAVQYDACCNDPRHLARTNCSGGKWP